MNTSVLTVDSIEKRFEKQTAVDRLSFDVRKGEVFALLGPNGAGKTTTIRMLLGIIQPDSGTVAFSLGNGQPTPLPAQIGYLPEDRGLYRDIPILKTLTYMGVLRGLNHKEAQSQGRSWLERVNLADRAGDKLETLSKGNQQKVQFISAILHRPEFAILDEPFAGLDPINQDFFIEIIRDLREKGTTILLCAHQMELVERLADRVLLLSRGREMLSGTLAQIRDHATATNKVVVRVRENADLAQIQHSPMIDQIEKRSASEYVFHIKRGEPLHEFLILAASALKPIDIHTEKISLHEIFVRAVGNDSAGNEKAQKS
jgi:ABC-2 type transport system ATP-binding protein